MSIYSLSSTLLSLLGCDLTPKPTTTDSGLDLEMVCPDVGVMSYPFSDTSVTDAKVDFFTPAPDISFYLRYAATAMDYCAYYMDSLPFLALDPCDGEDNTAYVGLTEGAYLALSGPTESDIVAIDCGLLSDALARKIEESIAEGRTPQDSVEYAACYSVTSSADVDGVSAYIPTDPTAECPEDTGGDTGS